MPFVKTPLGDLYLDGARKSQPVAWI